MWHENIEILSHLKLDFSKNETNFLLKTLLLEQDGGNVAKLEGEPETFTILMKKEYIYGFEDGFF